MAEPNSFPFVPDIDDDVPLPKNATEALPPLTPAEEIAMRARTAKWISDITQTPIEPTKDDVEAAHELARDIVENPEKHPDYALYPNEVIAMCAGIAAQYNHMIVKDLAELKLYVVNKLFIEAEKAEDTKVRLQALTKLGEVDGVDAFKKRTEVTHVAKPIEEVEKELASVIQSLKAKAIDAEYTEIKQPIAAKQVEECPQQQ